tara:strand:+ start:5921 stop:6127 length:207 start_codon:yes stop_codon:yes gene_type:complete
MTNHVIVKMPLSTQYRLKLTDICCRIITTDGVPVTLEERIWMNKLIEHNDHARHLVEELCGDSIWDIP